MTLADRSQLPGVFPSQRRPLSTCRCSRSTSCRTERPPGRSASPRAERPPVASTSTTLAATAADIITSLLPAATLPDRPRTPAARVDLPPSGAGGTSASQGEGRRGEGMRGSPVTPSKTQYPARNKKALRVCFSSSLSVHLLTIGCLWRKMVLQARTSTMFPMRVRRRPNFLYHLVWLTIVVTVCHVTSKLPERRGGATAVPPGRVASSRLSLLRWRRPTLPTSIRWPLAITECLVVSTVSFPSSRTGPLGWRSCMT